MSTVCSAALLALGGIAALAQAPTITAVLDAAGYTANLAHGSVFVVEGTNLCGTDAVAPTPYGTGPLSGAATQFAPAAVGSPFDASMIYCFNSSGTTQLAAEVPSDPRRRGRHILLPVARQTLPVPGNANAAACDSQFTPDALARLDSGGTVSAGFFNLASFSTSLTVQGHCLAVRVEGATGTFSRFSADTISQLPNLSAAAAAGCQSYQTAATSALTGAPISSGLTFLDAGNLTLHGPNVSNKGFADSSSAYALNLGTALAIPGLPPMPGFNSSPLITAGNYTLAGTGRSGRRLFFRQRHGQSFTENHRRAATDRESQPGSEPVLDVYSMSAPAPGNGLFAAPLAAGGTTDFALFAAGIGESAAAVYQ